MHLSRSSCRTSDEANPEDEYADGQQHCADIGDGSNRCPRRSGCKVPGSSFPYGVGERTSVTDGNVCATEYPLRRKRAAAVRECRSASG